ncbi:uncharacterized protein LOC128202586 [Galleria mellonella]|uniref:Uncharacterized protein LOC128202586 n=1 Tax=Galleria mellonella TaxID=7137 RepID=A0ABM3N6Z5_GALME|nr:uncharacterized protein LOC128202586 [Galleria mellonella]
MSFRNGSASGLDGLSPQHLKDLISSTTGDSGRALLESLVSLVNHMLSGGILEDIKEVFYGANLCALMKNNDDIRPIAVGTTLRRLVSKICCKNIKPKLTEQFQPKQLGFGTKGGCEAAVHAARTFINSGNGEVFLKVDVKNAFNSIDRRSFLAEVERIVPEVLPFLKQCYGSPSILVYNNHPIKSSVGCQQGDPMGPVIFSLGINSIIKKLLSPLNIWYLDDGSLGGNASVVLSDLEILINDLAGIGLQLNFDKCELYIKGSMSEADKHDIIARFDSLAPGIKIVAIESFNLLGVPLMNESIPAYVDEQIEKFHRSSERLFHINTHMALFVMRWCLFVPKFTYAMRSSMLWKFPEQLMKLDMILKETLIKILNCQLVDDAWNQATLPVRHGGLGVRKVSSVALPAFLASVHASNPLCGKIINPSSGSVEIWGVGEAVNAWQLQCPSSDMPNICHSQRQWDEPLCIKTQQNLVTHCESAETRARLQAVAERESGYWLQAFPSTNTGTLLDDCSFTLLIGLRLGVKIVQPHRCSCGASVEELGYHGLSCVRSAGRIPRHAMINNIIHRALAMTQIPAILEPNGIFREDGKRPDGVTLVPWKMGKCLVWDATCVDTLAPSHLSKSSSCSGAAAVIAEAIKRQFANDVSVRSAAITHTVREMDSVKVGLTAN